MKVIEVKNVSYQTNGKDLLQHIDLTLKAGEKFAMLGANGSGKSTLIDIITGDIRPTEGEVKFYGDKIGKHFSRLGVLYDDVLLFPKLKVKEILNYLGSYMDVKDWRDPSLMQLLRIEDIMNKEFAVLSSGERKRVSLYVAMFGDPEILILDEPTANLDPDIRSHFWTYISQLEGVSVFFTTHQWEEVKEFTQQVCFLKEGQMVMKPCAMASLLEAY